MSRTWLEISVELLSGSHAPDLWPTPGRIFAVAPTHTFRDLAEAINDAFARWDRSHISEFTLADGTPVCDVMMMDMAVDSPFGPIHIPADIDRTRVASRVKPGESFRFVFDLGDNWVHECTVAQAKVDPIETLGIVPEKPLPYWGWGTIPDQYGRRYADDDGESPIPPRPKILHPMLSYRWPGDDAVPPIVGAGLQATIAAGDSAAFLKLVVGAGIDGHLSDVARGALQLLQRKTHKNQAVVAGLVSRLYYRDAPGDKEIAAELIALLR